MQYQRKLEHKIIFSNPLLHTATSNLGVKGCWSHLCSQTLTLAQGSCGGIWGGSGGVYLNLIQVINVYLSKKYNLF